PRLQPARRSPTACPVAAAAPAARAPARARCPTTNLARARGLARPRPHDRDASAALPRRSRRDSFWGGGELEPFGERRLTLGGAVETGLCARQAPLNRGQRNAARRRYLG